VLHAPQHAHVDADQANVGAEYWFRDASKTSFVFHPYQHFASLLVKIGWKLA
jgi:hypothetical protein